MNTKTICLAALLYLAISLQGCSTIGKPYRELNPQDAESRVKANNGYHELQFVTTGKSKIVFRSEGMGYPVKVSICFSDTPCEKFKYLDTVADGGDGVLLPWIAKMTRVFKGFVVLEIAPEQQVHIKGYSSWWFSNGTVGSTSGSCGPLTSSFSPLANHVYLVQFLWIGGQCKQIVLDATNLDDPKPVPNHQY